MRICLDARKLNKILVPIYDSPSRIEEVIRKCEGKKWLTATDITSGYINVPLEINSRKYTAFTWNGIQYRYRVLPFVLKVSGQTFIKCLEGVLSEKLKKNLAVYVDDLVICSDTFEHHLKHLEEFFRCQKSRNQVKSK